MSEQFSGEGCSTIAPHDSIRSLGRFRLAPDSEVSAMSESTDGLRATGEAFSNWRSGVLAVPPPRRNVSDSFTRLRVAASKQAIATRDHTGEMRENSAGHSGILQMALGQIEAKIGPMQGSSSSDI